MDCQYTGWDTYQPPANTEVGGFFPCDVGTYTGLPPVPPNSQTNFLKNEKWQRVPVYPPLSPSPPYPTYIVFFYYPIPTWEGWYM